MFLSKVVDTISNAVVLAGHSRTAMELRNFSDKQLSDIGVSRKLLEQGASAYPWRAEVIIEQNEIPNNVTNLDFSDASQKMLFPNTSKAA